jgi:hypothetical protein
MAGSRRTESRSGRLRQQSWRQHVKLAGQRRRAEHWTGELEPGKSRGRLPSAQRRSAQGKDEFWVTNPLIYLILHHFDSQTHNLLLIIVRYHAVYNFTKVKATFFPPKMPSSSTAVDGWPDQCRFPPSQGQQTEKRWGGRGVCWICRLPPPLSSPNACANARIR